MVQFHLHSTLNTLLYPAHTPCHIKISRGAFFAAMPAKKGWWRLSNLGAFSPYNLQRSPNKKPANQDGTSEGQEGDTSDKENVSLCNLT